MSRLNVTRGYAHATDVRRRARARVPACDKKCHRNQMSQPDGIETTHLGLPDAQECPWIGLGWPPATGASRSSRTLEIDPIKCATHEG